MAKYCMKCGAPLPAGSKFCMKCGTPVPDAGKSVKTAGTEETMKKASSARQRPAVQKKPPAPKVKSGSGAGTRFVCALLVIALLFTGFVKPGFIIQRFRRPKGDDPGYVIHDPGEPSAQPKPSDDPGDQYAVLGHSKELAYSPCEGVFISAPADTFYEDTMISVEPLTGADRTMAKTMNELASQGEFAIAAYEVSAGMEDDDVAPGTYTVFLDLDTLDVPGSLRDDLAVYRLGDDGTYYEMTSHVDGKNLVYRTDQNSVALIIARVVVYGALIYFGYPKAEEIIKNYYKTEFQAPLQYFYNTKKKEFNLKRTTEYATYRLHWAMEDIGVDYEALTNRLNEITRSYMDRADEIYKQYEEDRLFGSTNILNIFSSAKDKLAVLNDAILADPEYKRISQQMEVPEIVEFATVCIDKSFSYLKNHEYVKMPTGVVEITSTKSSGDLAKATSRQLHEAWVEVNLGAVKNGGQSARDTFLVTMTHELLHVCQQGYRAAWADSVRFDEMTAVHMERRAMPWYQMNGDIDWDSQMDVNPTDYWSTLKLGLDHYWAGKDGDDSSVMQHEGYNLALFVEFLEERTGRTMWAGRLLNAREWKREGGISAPLMRAFGLNQQEFDTYYQLWVRKNKNNFADQYNSNEREYMPNKEITIGKGGRYHVVVQPDAGYSTEIRGFSQSTSEPMALLLVPDTGLASEQPDLQIIPVDPFSKFNKGAVIPALSEFGFSDLSGNRNILEVHTFIQSKDLSRTTGYTIYAWDKTKQVSAGQDKDHLILRMPENSYPADDGILGGYVMVIEDDEGTLFNYDISPDRFEKEVKIKKTDIYGKRDLDEELTVSIKLCEYVLNGQDKVLGEESDEVWFAMGPAEDERAALKKFTGAWAPEEYKGKVKSSDWIIGLVYLEDENEFGEFEGQLDWINRREDRWVEIRYFDYDPKTRTLTIDFDKNNVNATGIATYQLVNDNTLIMSNSSGSWTFIRMPSE